MRRTRGFALVMAIFLIVVLASIGAYLFAVAAGQTEAAAQDEQGAHAYQAARGGIEWGAYRVLRDATCPVAATLAMPGGFSAEVSCTQTGLEREGDVDVTIFLVTATGCNATPCGTLGPRYVERQLSLTLSR
jgi:MSHA biogenesis protein MshP